MNTDYHIYVIFPQSQEGLCEFITQHIIESFSIECEGITYDYDKINIKKINKIIEEQCILIIGYEGNISYGNCYKLGMAHAKNRIVILINILPDQDINYKENPEYIRKHFFVIFQSFVISQSEDAYKEELKKITRNLEAIINVILINDFSSILYLKAIEWCNILETKTKVTITKLDQNVFNNRLIQYKEHFLKKYNTTLFDLYLEDDKSLYKILLQCICDDKYDRMKIEQLLAKSQQQPQLTQKNSSDYAPNVTYNFNIRHDNQYGEGDNFGGDEVEGNKTG
ncbi:hypothetical protein [Nostoc sp. NMS4]|uniref:hypothetical protein n=1 Tax=Nostoc sp. NMS4 TaxID=2815390 RepID=UPI0025EF10A3|nr:hypothetical protein [Nostoc sp. NMS4]MBN3927675.1 hypothetical protein [Nostoc sp. NMS4]